MVFKYIIIIVGLSSFFLSSCSDMAMDLQVGDCYIDKADTLAPGETAEAGAIEIVSCTEPHNYEIIAVFSAVPNKYKSYENPIDEICYNAIIDYIFALHPNENETSIQYIFGKFDERFSYSYNFNTISKNSIEPDLNAGFNCEIFSKNSLINGPFKNTIKSF